jgi:precorrin-2 methylase
MKNSLFQYYNGYKTVEDTELITLEEAYQLWDKYFSEVASLLTDKERVQMCIWGDAESNTDYSKVIKEIDFRDCVVENGRIYKITKERVL